MKTLKKILCMKDTELGNYLIQTLKKYYPKVETDKDNYIYAKGTGAVCLVSHIDTVRGKTDEPVMLSINRNVIRNTKGVLGADDRAGVYGILEAIKSCAGYKMPMPSVLFTNYEESGGRGVKKFVAAKKFHTEGLTLLVELDRKGCNEYVFYSTTLPKPIKEYMESFGFKEERGSYSDICDLTNEYCIPSVNISVGYYAQHTQNERLHYDELLMTIERVVDICNDPPAKLHPVDKPLYQSWKGGHRTYGGGYGEDWDYSGYNSRANQAFNTGSKHTPPVSTAGPTAAKQTELKFTSEINGEIAKLIIELKDEIKSELTTVYSLDAIGQRFFNHEHNLQIIEKLGEIEEAFFNHITIGDVGDTAGNAFTSMWGELMVSTFYKTHPKIATSALACI